MNSNQKRQRLIFIIAEKMYNSSRCLKSSMYRPWPVLSLATTLSVINRICEDHSIEDLEVKTIQMMELT